MYPDSCIMYIVPVWSDTHFTYDKAHKFGIFKVPGLKSNLKCWFRTVTCLSIFSNFRWVTLALVSRENVRYYCQKIRFFRRGLKFEIRCSWLYNLIAISNLISTDSAMKHASAHVATNFPPRTPAANNFLCCS